MTEQQPPPGKKPPTGPPPGQKLPPGQQLPAGKQPREPRPLGARLTLLAAGLVCLAYIVTIVFGLATGQGR